jgi:hypothetical protein
MAERNKVYLKQEFRDGERPTGTDFADFIDSFINKQDDGISVDPVNKNLNIPGGVTLGDTPAGTTGTLRFNAGNVQVFDGANWVNVGGAGGAFTPVLGGPSVAFDGGISGNVGIGAFAVAPAFKLEVVLGANNNEADRVRFGTVALSNGQGAFQSSAQFAHTTHADGNTDFALRQSPAGDVTLNAPLNQPISITQGRTNTRAWVAPSGAVVIGNNAILPLATAAHLLQVNGDAGKMTGGNIWTILSDGRYKKDVMEFKDGLEKLMQIRPVRFKYTGLPAGIPQDNEEVGIIGQEMQEIFPYMVSSGSISDHTQPAKKDDVLMYNGNALTYVMVNAIQELTTRVKELESQLEEAKKK